LGGAGNAVSLGVVLARLQTIQEFAATAWQSTRLQKVVNLLTLIGVLHNAAMLSRELGETLGELASNMLGAIGIKDEEGNDLDINSILGNTISDFTKSVVGEEVYNDVSTAWKKSSRIVASAAMIAYTVRSINDTSKDVIEWIGENTGKIGNALKKYGVVGERAYPWMSERVQAQDVYRRKFQRFEDGIEGLDDAASSFAEVTSNVREIQEEFSELKQQRDEFKTLVSSVQPDQVATSSPENEPIQSSELANSSASQSPEVSIDNGLRG
jgi:hypothetical protein